MSQGRGDLEIIFLNIFATHVPDDY